MEMTHSLTKYKLTSDSLGQAYLCPELFLNGTPCRRLRAAGMVACPVGVQTSNGRVMSRPPWDGYENAKFCPSSWDPKGLLSVPERDKKQV